MGKDKNTSCRLGTSFAPCICKSRAELRSTDLIFLLCLCSDFQPKPRAFASEWPQEWDSRFKQQRWGFSAGCLLSLYVIKAEAQRFKKTSVRSCSSFIPRVTSWSYKGSKRQGLLTAFFTGGVQIQPTGRRHPGRPCILWKTSIQLPNVLGFIIRRSWMNLLG